MGQLQGPTPDFAGLCANPSIERMLTELSDHEFEHFVAYVFEQAGYVVEDTASQRHLAQGLDLKLYTGAIAPEHLRAGVQVKHWRDSVGAGEVRSLRGGVRDNSNVPGYFVTTSNFGGAALREANGTPPVLPIDGERFLRYINYVCGTRAFVPPAPQDEFSALDGTLAPVLPEAIIAAETVTRRSSHTTKVLTLANNKGGVGKTTTALNLAFGLSGPDYQQHVLVVDMDPQANMTRELFSVGAQNGTPTHLGDYFAHRNTLANLVRAIHPTHYPNLWLIPSHHDLALADRGIPAGAGAELRFVRDLHAANVAPPHVRDGRPFDWIIIDTGPSMGFFTRLALAASHYVLTPVSPGAFAEWGDSLLKRTIATMAALMGKEIHLLGGVVTQWKVDALNTQFRAKIENSVSVIGPPVPVDRNIERAHLEVARGRGRQLFTAFPASPAARAYRDVIDELVNRVKGRRDT